jgi:hypothetical protein
MPYKFVFSANILGFGASINHQVWLLWRHSGNKDLKKSGYLKKVRSPQPAKLKLKSPVERIKSE